MWQEVKKTLILGWPIILGNMTQIALGIIDSAMVGAIHSSQLAAAAFVNNLIALPLILAIGLTTAISPLVASALGEKDEVKPLRILFNGGLIVTAMALLFAIGIHFGADMVYYFGQDEIVAELSRPYLIWMGWGMIPMAAFMAMKQFADGLGRTRVPMYLALLSIPINVLVNYAFIFGEWGAPRMELEGAGVGTLASRIVVMIAIFWLIAKGEHFAPYRQHLSDQLQFRYKRFRDIFRIGIPASLQYGMETAAFALSGIMAGWLGYVQQAAHQIAISIASFTFMVSVGISAAGSIRVGYAYGRQDWAHARQVGQSTLLIAIAYGVLCAVFFVLGRHQLPLLFNDEAKVVTYAAVLLFLTAVFQISDAVQAIGVGLLRGLQDVRVPTLFVFLAYWAIGIPSGYALAFWYGMDVGGIWIGLVIGLSASAILLTLRFLRLTAKNQGSARRLG
ncbi:MATE family efflux transporter [Phaeodactylibacter luteus]|uniref:Multidrug-efflux transporter n=1 Tax=Phaeodactylibacter luteus TaxID=1564516 RepID=A0A5C6RID0_9BACT|nr:MATE family efflux transporter [Phaeodactylibacter luteus]TXB61873.1 MATE family efflux transporter [Phaeodactylibacter luteus]